MFLQAQISCTPGLTLENEKVVYIQVIVYTQIQSYVSNCGGLPFEDESNDKVWVDPDSPITLFPRRVRLRVVRRQNYS